MTRLIVVAVMGLCLTQAKGGKVDMLVGEEQVFSDGQAEGNTMPTELIIEGHGPVLKFVDAEDARQQITGWQRKAGLWEHAGWRAQVHLVRERIEDVSDKDAGVYHDEHIQRSEYIARAFVRIARELKLPLWIAVAISEEESKFDLSAIGRAGEVSLMQVKPFETRPMAKIKADPAFAIDWALSNCFAPVYHKAGLRAALMHYNGSDRKEEYADGVMLLKLQSYTDKLWKEVPE